MEQLIIKYLAFAQAELRKAQATSCAPAVPVGKLGKLQHANTKLAAFKQSMKRKLEAILDTANDASLEEWYNLKLALGRIHDEYVQEYICISFSPGPDTSPGLN